MTYSEKETAAIIRRALEIQNRQNEAVSGGSLTLAEIEHVGAEVGISPEAIRQAAEEVGASADTFRRSFWLGAASLQEREADAPSLAAGVTLASLVPVIEDAAGHDGEGRIIGDALQWRSRMSLWRVSVKPVPRGGLRIRAEMRIFPAAAGLFPGLMGGIGLGAGLGVGLGVGIAVLHAPLFCVLVPVGALVGSWLLARAIYRRVARSAAASVRKIVEAVRGALGGP